MKRNIAANFIGQGWAMLMNFAFIPVYVEYLGMEAYGLIGLFGMLQVWLSLLDFGMAPTLSREMARYSAGSCDVDAIRSILRSIEILAAIVAVTVALGVYFVSGWLARNWLNLEDLTSETVAHSVSIMGIVIGLRFLETIYRSCIIGLQRQVLLNVVNCSMSTIRGLGAVGVLAWASNSVAAFFIWQGFISILALLSYSLAVYATLPAAKGPIRFSIQAILGVVQYASGMTGIAVLSLLLTQSDKLILTKILTLTEYGYYSLAAMAAGGLFSLASPIAQAYFPRVSQLHAAGDQKLLLAVYHRGAQLVSVVVGSATAMLFFFSSDILRLWSGNPEIVAETSFLVSLMSLGNLMNILMWIPYQTQLAFGWTSLAIRINIVAIAILLPAIVWITPVFGAIGAAWVWILLNCGYFTIGVHLMYRKILCEEKWNWYIRDILLPVFVAVASAISFRLILPSYLSPTSLFIALAIISLSTLGSACLAADRIRGGIFQMVSSTVLRFSVLR